MRRLVLAIALVVIVVLVAGAGVVAAQRNGDSALEWAREAGHAEVVALLEKAAGGE